MALTNVWRRDANGEWVRTTACEADNVQKYTVSADSRQFRCYSCFHYVTFVKSNGQFISHFKHSRGDVDKSCEDRSINPGRRNTSDMPLIPAPLRLTVERGSVSLEIGFPAAGEADFKKAIQNHAVISISGKSGTPHVYRVDESRFSPHMTCWLMMPLDWADSFRISIQPESACPQVWHAKAEAISEDGALFELHDGKSGRRIAAKGDVVVGRDYCFLSRRHFDLYCLDSSVTIQKIPTGSPLWKAFVIRANAYTEEASDFFFDQLHVRLTKSPSDILALWPPMLEDDDMLDTNLRRIIMLVKGESDMETYPSNRLFVIDSEIVTGTKLYLLNNTGALQMVCAERYNQKLKCLYIRPLDKPHEATPPILSILDDDGNAITADVIPRIPVRGILHFLSEVDGSVEVWVNESFRYRLDLSAGEETRMIDVDYRMRLIVRQGLDVIRRLDIAPDVFRAKAPQKLPAWSGRNVPFSSRYAGILEKLDLYTEIRCRVITALQKRRIPEDGLKALRRLMEEQA